MNDSEDELRQLASFIAGDLGPETPWHISRFHPTYHLTDRPPTALGTLLKARRIGLDAGLRYVYTGNVPGEEGEGTYCYNCGELLIDRVGFFVRSNTIEKGCCPSCGAAIDGVGM
jgi:pyruvate formate lyase activating enzyme